LRIVAGSETGPENTLEEETRHPLLIPELGMGGSVSSAGRLCCEPGLHVLPPVSEMTANAMRARAFRS
jgi:hypothetical protein